MVQNQTSGTRTTNRTNMQTDITMVTIHPHKQTLVPPQPDTQGCRCIMGNVGFIQVGSHSPLVSEADH